MSDVNPETGELFRPGETCWRVAHVDRGAFVIDGADYYKAFRESVLQAEHSVYLLAWDLAEGIDMVRDGFDDGFPTRVGDFLYAVLDAKPGLRIHILLWDYSMIYIAERDWLPFTRWRREPHPRLFVEQDNALPMGASQHQKIAVIDESLAFCGGLDFSFWRWDTTEHKAFDPRRHDPKGDPYQPYHDTELALTGGIVATLAELCAYRWRRATGRTLPRTAGEAGRRIWPEGVEVDFSGVRAGVALTFADYGREPGVRQIENLHLEIIRNARRYLYLENQYLSSHTIAQAVAGRLREENGPEVVLLLTKDTGKWIQEGTMGVMRERLLEILGEADNYGRLGVYYPYVVDPDGYESQVYIHAKLIIADDRLVKIGSANLSNRSMRVDSEVDIALMAEDGAEWPPARSLLHRLLAVHFGCCPAEIERALAAAGSVNGAIRELGKRGGGHTLLDFDYGCSGSLQRKLADTQILDPDEPIDPGHWLRATLWKRMPDTERIRWSTFLRYAGAAAAGLVLLWGLGQGWFHGLDPAALAAFAEDARTSVWAVPAGIALVAAAGMVALPLNAVLVLLVLVLGPWRAYLCGLAGGLLGAAALFGAARLFGAGFVRRLAKEDVDSLSQQIGARGLWSVALLRILRVAPFPVLNLVAGASHLKFGAFLRGSLVGMAAGMFVVVLLTGQAARAVAMPSVWNWGLFALAAGATVFGVRTLRRLVRWR